MTAARYLYGFIFSEFTLTLLFLFFCPNVFPENNFSLWTNKIAALFCKFIRISILRGELL